MTLEEALQNYIARHQVDGVAYTRHAHGLYWTDDDNALYTGLMLGAMAYRYAADPSPDKLDAVRLCLRGVSLLTLATGTRGVLVRRAMPRSMAPQFGLNYPLAEDNYWKTKPLETRGEYTFLLKTTKDQVTGILFGLSACRKLLAGVDAQIDDSMGTIIADLHHAITEREGSLRDHNYETHGTSAHKLDAPLRLNLEALAYSVGIIDEKPSENWFNHVRLYTAHYNTYIQNAYSHGLNAMTSHALTLLEEYHLNGTGVAQLSQKIDRVIREESNPLWELLLRGDTSDEGDLRLDELSESPYSRFFIWNKYRAEITERADTSGPQIDYMLAGFMREFHREDTP